MTKFTDHNNRPVYIDLRRVIAISEPSENSRVATYLWTDADKEEGYFGVRENIEHCLKAWDKTH